MTYGKLTDSANGLQLDRVIQGAIKPVPPVKALAVELAIADRAAGLADQRELTLMLGLGQVPGEPRSWDASERRAVPDSFRRTRN